MVSQKVRVKNPSGLHLRPAGVLCSTALQLSAASDLHFVKRL